MWSEVSAAGLRCAGLGRVRVCEREGGREGEGEEGREGRRRICAGICLVCSHYGRMVAAGLRRNSSMQFVGSHNLTSSPKAGC